MPDAKKYAEVAWTAADVQSLAPKLSLEEAEEWLKSNEKHIRDGLISRGWDVLSALLAYDAIDTSDKDQEAEA